MKFIIAKEKTNGQLVGPEQRYQNQEQREFAIGPTIFFESHFLSDWKLPVLYFNHPISDQDVLWSFRDLYD